jgi:alpha-galactosidase
MELRYEIDLDDGGRALVVITADQYPQWPEAVLLQANLTNLGGGLLHFDTLIFPEITLNSTRADFKGSLWTFQGAADHWGMDFAFPLHPGFERENSLDHVDGGEGGGIPLVYFWNAQVGLALAYASPRLTSLRMPVRASLEGEVRAALVASSIVSLKSGESMSSLPALVSLHQGDFFAPLALYRQVLVAQGMRLSTPCQEDFEPAWCSWGYEFDIRPEEVVGVLPAIQKLGIRWLTLDDRWFDVYGDWNPHPHTFPGGDAQMRQIVDRIHAAGAYAQLWWYPLAVEDGVGGYSSHAYTTAQVLRQNSDWLCLNADGNVARNNRELAILCPALPAVQAYIQAQTERFISGWGFDGHKLDNIYSVPACYNPTHHHAHPEESLAGFADVYRLIQETTRRLKPFSVTQVCPCGTTPNLLWLPYADQVVTADPTSSTQIRQRIKFYKALLGSASPVFADHVELSDGGVDFSSCIGSGGVLGTKFVWPADIEAHGRLEEWWPLTPEKQALYQRWFDLYHKYRLAEGEYVDAYDLAFDRPETHLVRKDGRLYYAFFAGRLEECYSGHVQLRLLSDQPHRLMNIVTGEELGVLRGPAAMLEVSFAGSLLLEATPLH